MNHEEWFQLMELVHSHHQEMQVMDQQIEEAAARIEQLLEESRSSVLSAQVA